MASIGSVSRGGVDFLHRVGDVFNSIAVGIQYARTLQTLRYMSDAELTQIGITRADIPAYAQKLVDEGL
mgnify:CR=1 FL=1